MTRRTFRLHAALHDVIGLSQIIDRCERDKQRTLRDATSRAGFAYQKYTIISGQVQSVLPGAAESIRAQRLCRPDDNRLSCNRNADQPIQERCRVYVPRTLEALILDAARHFSVVLATGARQVGKTTLLRHLAEERRTYITLDDPLVLDLARTDPALFMQRFPPTLLIDEIQYAPGLLPYLKMAVDRAGEPGMFWLTGSQQFHLMKGISESLAGRVAVLNLLGLSRWELMRRGLEARPSTPTPEEIVYRTAGMKQLTLKELYRLIRRGSLPAIALNEAMDRDLFYRSYVQTYLQRDVRDLARVGDELAFLRFL